MHDVDYRHEHELEEHDFLGCCLNCRRSLEIIKPHLLEFHASIREHTPDTLTRLSQHDLFRKYQVLDDLVHLDIGDRLGELILTDPQIAAVLPAVRSYYATFFSLHEAHLAKELFEADDPWARLASYPLYPRYETLVRKQADALNLSGDDHLAFVGCGALPLSLILAARLFGVRSTGIDTDRTAIDLARQCIERLDLADRVSVIEGDESCLARLPATAVLVAALAEPKSRVFRTIRTILRTQDPVPVVCRTYTGIRAVLYRPVSAEDIEGFTVTDEIAPSEGVNNTLIFLEVERDV